MAVSYSRQIPPGGTGEITLKIKTDGKAGQTIRHHATVYTDDPDHAAVELTLTGDVIPAADIHPIAARLIGSAGTPIQTDITITAPPPNPFDITGVEASDGKNIRVVLKKTPESGGLSYVLHITNQKKDPGRYTDMIRLTTTSAISPELVVRVYGIIR